MAFLATFLSAVKIESFIIREKNYIFNIFVQNIYCGYKLEPPHLECSNEYPQSIFWIKNKKNCIPQ